jgi:hypothetical protein
VAQWLMWLWFSSGLLGLSSVAGVDPGSGLAVLLGFCSVTGVQQSGWGVPLLGVEQRGCRVYQRGWGLVWRLAPMAAGFYGCRVEQRGWGLVRRSAPMAAGFCFRQAHATLFVYAVCLL